jgi:hypothetical protein
MVTLRSRAATLMMISAAVLGSIPTPSRAAAAQGTLSGVTRDAAGHALAGVEVLVLSDPTARAAVQHAISNASGQFLVGSLQPGIYRVAAVKSGYIAAFGRVNTLLRSSVDLVLRPAPKPGEPGAEKVAQDLSWTLRLPPRSILREVGALAVLDEHGTGGARSFADRFQDVVRGQVDHVVAMGSWRPGGDGPSSSLEGTETRMRLAGSLGERGAIQVRGRRGSFESSSRPAVGGVSRDASDVDVDVSYDTGDDANLAMSAFYSRGDLTVGEGPMGSKNDARQGQRSWGYDASWKKQVDSSSRVALQVGFHDASLDVTDVPGPEWYGARDASNRAIGAEGSYESAAAEGHLVQLGVRAQRLMLSAPEVRLGRSMGAFPLDGADGWSVLIDAGDQWSVASPWAVTYGLSVRQDFQGAMPTTLTPRVGGSWSVSRLKAHAEISYLAATSLTGLEPSTDWPETGGSRIGYDVRLETPVSPEVSLVGSASFVPLQADRWASGGVAGGLDGMFFTNGRASDRNAAIALERSAPSASVTVRVEHGHAEGALAPALDAEVPIVVLSDRSIVYNAARFGTHSARTGSSLALEYRALRDESPATGESVTIGTLRTVEMEFAQDLVRLWGGRASCRLLLAARTAVNPGSAGTAAPAGGGGEEARRFAALQKRVSAGVSLSF